MTHICNFKSVAATLKTEKTRVMLLLYLIITRWIQNVVIWTCNQYKKLLRDSTVCTKSRKAGVRVASDPDTTSQVPSSCTWLVATAPDRTDRELQPQLLPNILVCNNHESWRREFHRLTKC